MSNNTQPEIRFPGFMEDWEQRKLGELAESFEYGLNASAKKFDGSNKYIRITDIDDISHKFNQSGVTSPDIDFASADNYKLKKGDILFARTGASVGKTYMYRESDGLVYYAGFLIRARIKSKISSEFVFQTTFTDSYNRFIKITSQRSGQPGVNAEEYSNFKIMIPNYEEQNAIGCFFKKIDDTITLHQRKLDLLKETKKGFLQKMFPKNGAKVPEIRFPGFTGDWEQRKLASMTNYKNGKGHEDKQSTIGKLELINLNSISISGGLKHSGKFIDEADDTLQKDDLVMILSDVGHGDLLGRVALIPEDDRFVLNQRVALLRPNATADPQFLFSYINAHQYYFKAQGAGMSQLNISKGSVENFISFVPIIEEQKKIGTFFKKLDDTIALHQRKLDLLKETKKGFLQKMFV
ncbi:restriction endonuclease subunit S [Enterococcus faecium]|uniref:restriction endonuclease subunit S n=3 Tax=Enterococcus faecium TaxID=1352 RepID=UPI000B9FACC4|nr:restriction endonuclease subunit S [Enterococcus faecium]OZN12963.1 restriction endonuclease subunit S [Enterococcus faecium]RSA65905.1 restriction endonuclease subunit S [Enterococcus faecium]HAZ0588217.1 restriction endonuclease subunit S [Enterococcus faecium]